MSMSILIGDGEAKKIKVTWILYLDSTYQIKIEKKEPYFFCFMTKLFHVGLFKHPTYTESINLVRAL